MKQFQYTIKDESGIHARPAGAFVKKAAEFQSRVTIYKGEKSADGKRILNLMGLGVKKGDEIRVIIEGPDEEQAAEALQEFLATTL